MIAQLLKGWERWWPDTAPPPQKRAALHLLGLQNSGIPTPKASHTEAMCPDAFICFHRTLLLCWGHGSRYWCVGCRCREWNSFLGFRRKGCKDRNLCPQSLLFCPVEGGMMSYVFLVRESAAKKRQAWGGKSLLDDEESRLCSWCQKR